MENYETIETNDNPIQVDSHLPMQISELSLKYLKESAGWNLFFSILNFIGALLMLLFGFGMFAFIPFLKANMPLYNIPSTNPMEALVQSSNYFLFLGFIYILLGGFYIYFGVLLAKFYNRVNKAVELKSSDELQLAFKAQRNFFRAQGIITIAGFIFLIIFIIIAMIQFSKFAGAF